MVGRLDDWLKVVMEKARLCVDPGYLEWAGVAVFKKAYKIFRERGYRIRLLSAVFRNPMHWSEFIGGDVVISPPHAWQVRYNASDIEVISRIDNPVDGKPRTRSPSILRIFVERTRRMASLISNSMYLGPLGGLFDSLSPPVTSLRL